MPRPFALPRVFDPSRPLVFAHRGGAALRPENTMAAFEHAVALGADGVECDVHLSRDGEVVIIHDATLDRTTDATGPVAALTAAELAQVDAAYHFECDGTTPYRGRGYGVPRLSDLLRRFRNLRVVVELKGSDPALARAAVEVARRHGALGRVCFGGFDHEVVEAARKANHGVITSASPVEARRAMYRAWFGFGPGPTLYRGFQLPERYGRRRVVTRRFVRVMRRVGLPVQVWTVNRAEDMRRLLKWGVQGIITDVPDLAIPVVREWHEAELRRHPRRLAARLPGWDGV